MDRDVFLRDLDVGYEAMTAIKQFLENDQYEAADSLLHDMQFLVQKCNKALQGLESKASMINSMDICGKNLEYSIKKFFSFPSKRKMLFHCEIFSFYWSLRYLAYLYLDVSKSDESLREYRKRLFDELRMLHKNRSKKRKFKYKVSIWLGAFNKLKYTKIAVDSILKYTDFSQGDIELITVNNGSSDKTEEFFDSLPNVKKVNRKFNVLGLPMDPFLCEGEYLLAFSNDAVATPNWLENLLLCIESSDDIAMVVPTCNEDSISLDQGISVPYRNDVSEINAIQKFAYQYNRSNPALWEDRIALMPFVSISRTDLINLQCFDPSFVKAQFTDDDVSTLFRRTGWRMVLAGDTFLHHFGSVTFKDAPKKDIESDYDEMRKVYFDKWGIDAWESREILGTKAILPWFSPKKQSRILWVEPKFGMDFLTVKNYYRRKGYEDVNADALIVNPCYFPDAKYYFNRCISAENLPQMLSKLQERYDLIGMGACLHEIVDGSAIDLLEQLYGLLNPGGMLIVPIKNWCSARNLKIMIESGGNHSWAYPANTFKELSLWGFLGELSKHAFLNDYARAILVETDKKLCADMHSRLLGLFSNHYSSEDFECIMQISILWFRFQKK